MAKLAIISDIHGNLLALEAVLRDIERARADAVLCLGDVVGYGPEPAECLELVRRACRVVIRGNHEDALLEGADLSNWNPVACRGITYAREVLGDELTNYATTLPRSFAVPGLIFGVHDSPLEGSLAESYLRDAKAAARAFGGIAEPVCLVGHTHVAACFMTNGFEDDAPVPTAAVRSFSPGTAARPGASTLELRRDGRAIVNPGAVGQPRDGDPRASYAILDAVNLTVEFRRVAYDIADAMKRFEWAGLCRTATERLAVGA
jgi:predicted phosphodiesterase